MCSSVFLPTVCYRVFFFSSISCEIMYDSINVCACSTIWHTEGVWRHRHNLCTIIMIIVIWSFEIKTRNSNDDNSEPDYEIVLRSKWSGLQYQRVWYATQVHLHTVRRHRLSLRSPERKKKNNVRNSFEFDALCLLALILLLNWTERCSAPPLPLPI